MDAYRTLLKRDESYAIHALINIYENPGTSSAEIAARLHIPPAFLAKVMRRLVTAGFIESRMGRKGGVSLLVDLSRLTMLDVIEAVSGKLVMDVCQTREKCATQLRKGHCRLHGTWNATGVIVRHAFASVKMITLCDPPVRQPEQDSELLPVVTEPEAAGD